MNTKKAISLLLICYMAFLFKPNLQAQILKEEGYLVNLQNDTLYGWIEYEANATSDKLKFTKNNNTFEESYLPEDLKMFYLNSGQIYKSATVKIDLSSLDLTRLRYSKESKWITRTVFLKAEVLGVTSLYAYVNEYGKQHFFIEKENRLTILEYGKYFQKIKGQQVIKTNSTYKGQLNYLFRDCKQSNFDLKQVKFKKEDLKKLVKNYNICMDSPTTFTSKKNKLVTRFNVIIGFSNTTLNYTASLNFISTGIRELEATRFNKSLKPTVGIGFNLILPSKKRKISIYNELNYRFFEVSSKESYLNADNVMVEVEQHAKDSHLRLMTMGRVHLLKKIFHLI